MKMNKNLSGTLLVAVMLCGSLSLTAGPRFDRFCSKMVCVWDRIKRIGDIDQPQISTNVPLYNGKNGNGNGDNKYHILTDLCLKGHLADKVGKADLDRSYKNLSYEYRWSNMKRDVFLQDKHAPYSSWRLRRAIESMVADEASGLPLQKHEQRMADELLTKGSRECKRNLGRLLCSGRSIGIENLTREELQKIFGDFYQGSAAWRYLSRCSVIGDKSFLTPDVQREAQDAEEGDIRSTWRNTEEVPQDLDDQVRSKLLSAIPARKIKDGPALQAAFDLCLSSKRLGNLDEQEQKDCALIAAQVFQNRIDKARTELSEQEQQGSLLGRIVFGK